MKRILALKMKIIDVSKEQLEHLEIITFIEWKKRESNLDLGEYSLSEETFVLAEEVVAVNAAPAAWYCCRKAAAGC